MLTPEGLDQIARAIDRVTADPEVSQALAETDAVVAPTQLFAQILGHDDFASTSEAEIDGAVDQIRSRAGPATARMSLEALIGTDSDGTSVAVAMVRLRGAADAELLLLRNARLINLCETQKDHSAPAACRRR